MNKPVSFKLAKLLKEKGFNEPCRFVHDNWNNIEDWYDIGREYHRNSEKNASVYYSAPTIAEVVMWLYEKHEIWIHITREGGWWHIVIEDLSQEEDEGTIEVNVSGVMSEAPFGINEEYEAGIEYVLENLI